MSLSIQSQNQEWDFATSNNSWTTLFSCDIYEGRTAVYFGDVYAYDPATGDAFRTRVRAMIRRDTGAAAGPVFAALFELLDTQKSLGAFFWDFRVRVSTGTIYLEGKGKASGTVYWNYEGILRTMLDDAYAP